jgi:hypothetical protein
VQRTRGLGAATVLDEAGVGDAPENTFAVLVARSGVTRREGAFEGAKFTFGFVDDDGRTFGPREQVAGGFIGERHVAVERLLDENEAGEKSRDDRVGEKLLPQRAERRDGAVVLVAIEREFAGGTLAFQQAGEPMQTLAVVLDVAAEFDFEMGKTVGADTVLQRLRQAVVHAVGCGNFRAG